jgi:hypothetical protein
MLGTILIVIAGLAFIFTALAVQARRDAVDDSPEKRILREAEEILTQAGRQLKKEAALLKSKTPLAPQPVD